MIAELRQNLARFCLRNPSFLRKSDAVISLHLLHFSTSGEAQSAIHSRVYELLVHGHQFSPESASKIASGVTRLRNPDNPDSVLVFLKECGFSHSQLERTMISSPQFLFSADLEKTIKPKFKSLVDFGISASDVAEILGNNPRILKRSVNKRIIPSLCVLKSFLGADELPKVLKVSEWFFTINLNISLIPNVELLKKCGASMDQIIWMMHRYPRFLMRKCEAMKKLVGKADELGASRSSKMYIHALRILSSFSDEQWELKLRTLRELGFSDDDIAGAFRKFPLVFGLSGKTLELKQRTLREVGFLEDDIAGVFRKYPSVFGLTDERIKKAKEVILANGKYDLSCIIHYPLSLAFGIETRHKPRMHVLELLEGKNLIQSWPSLMTICRMPNKKFYEKYVGPFVDEIGDVCLWLNE